MSVSSNKAVRAINSQQTDEIFLVTLDITHEDLLSPIYVVNNRYNIVSNGKTYIATAFDFTLPSQEDGVLHNSTLVIDNVDRTILETIRSIDSAPTIEANIILASDPDIIEDGPREFTLRNVTYNRNTISGDLVYGIFLMDYCGTHKYKNLSFPGLFG